jgi:hypothetical protein
MIDVEHEGAKPDVEIASREPWLSTHRPLWWRRAGELAQEHRLDGLQEALKASASAWLPRDGVAQAKFPIGADVLQRL